MLASAELLEVRKVIDGSYNILILASESTQQDIQTAQHILADSLQTVGKKVYVYPTSGGFTALPHRSATLTFAYQGRKIERLQYKISEDTVALTFVPFDGEIKQDTIHTDYSMAEIDAVIAIGVGSKDALPEIVGAHSLEDRNIAFINIDNTADNRQWGTNNLIFTDIPLYALLAVIFAHTFGLPIDQRWQQLAVLETKEQLPAFAGASPRLLRTIADLLETSTVT